MKRVVLVTTLAAVLVILMPAEGLAGDPVYTAASILRGEAPADCLKCRELTACALVRDLNKGVNLRQRWYGWRNAREQDVALIEKALADPKFCRQFPDCRFVGNGRDLETWSRKGWINASVRSIAYCGSNGCTVCVPALQPETKAE